MCDQVLKDETVREKFDSGLAEIRASTDLPDDAREWLEVWGRDIEFI